MYEENVKNVAEKIRAGYVDKSESKIEQLKKLDKKTRLAAGIFAYTFGIIGALILGLGMCLAMGVIGNFMALGVAIGCVGIAMVSVNYLIYKAIEKNAKKKYGQEILSLSNELLGDSAN